MELTTKWRFLHVWERATRVGMLSDSKITTRTSVGRVRIVVTIRNNSARGTCPWVYVQGAAMIVRSTHTGRDERVLKSHSRRIHHVGGPRGAGAALPTLIATEFPAHA